MVIILDGNVEHAAHVGRKIAGKNQIGDFCRSKQMPLSGQIKHFIPMSAIISGVNQFVGKGDESAFL